MEGIRDANATRWVGIRGLPLDLSASTVNPPCGGQKKRQASFKIAVRAPILVRAPAAEDSAQEASKKTLMDKPLWLRRHDLAVRIKRADQ